MSPVRKARTTAVDARLHQRRRAGKRTPITQGGSFLSAAGSAKAERAAALRRRYGQPHRRPCGGALRDPLIVAMGEAAFEVRLDLHRAALHVPRAVVLLR